MYFAISDSLFEGQALSADDAMLPHSCHSATTGRRDGCVLQDLHSRTRILLHPSRCMGLLMRLVPEFSLVGHDLERTRHGNTAIAVKQEDAPKYAPVRKHEKSKKHDTISIQQPIILLHLNLYLLPPKSPHILRSLTLRPHPRPHPPHSHPPPPH